LAAPRPIRASWPGRTAAGRGCVAPVRLFCGCPMRFPACRVRFFLLRVTLVSFCLDCRRSAYFAVGQALGVAAQPAGCAARDQRRYAFATIIPSSPGYVGTFHYFTARVATAFGGRSSEPRPMRSRFTRCCADTTATGFLLLGLAGLKDRAPSACHSLNDRPERHS
jgi:hypothetical protein